MVRRYQYALPNSLLHFSRIVGAPSPRAFVSTNEGLHLVLPILSLDGRAHQQRQANRRMRDMQPNSRGAMCGAKTFRVDSAPSFASLHSAQWGGSCRFGRRRLCLGVLPDGSYGHDDVRLVCAHDPGGSRSVGERRRAYPRPQPTWQPQRFGRDCQCTIPAEGGGAWRRTRGHTLLGRIFT